MKCQSCGNFEANFHYKSNINGEITERHLCQECAQKTEGGMFAGSTARLRPMQTLSGGMFDLFEGGLFTGRFFGDALSMPAMMGGFPTAAPEPSPGNLPEKDIPADAGEDIKKRRELNKLRSEMEREVRAESFERAAELRDEIYRLERE